MAVDPSPRRRAADRTADTGNGASKGTSTQKTTNASSDHNGDCNKNNTLFLGSQVGGLSVMSYSYTDEPLKLLAYDMWYFLQFARALPWVVMPLSPCDSGDLAELSPSLKNLYCLAIHGVLVVLQLAFLISLPFTVVLPVWLAGLWIVVFLVLNWSLCLLLNGDGIEFHSDPEYAEARPEHAHEQWVFLNGVAAGHHWMKNNLNRLALTFKRPVLGIHNRTSGILFDVVECLIQRNFGYATGDVRACYGILKEKLYSPRYSKVIFILHSQGGIEGGLVLDLLLQELPQDLLRKLEVYTFGNAANHFNNPHRHVSSQRLVRENPLAAMTTTTTETTADTATTTPLTASPVAVAPFASSNGSRPPPPPLRTDTSSLSSIHTSSAAFDRALGHVEHYAHTTDFVAIWGILHFVRRVAATHTIPRFIGRVFVRSSERGGHQFCQHYLDGMFPLARDADGNLVGAAEQNEFMESEVEMGVPGSEMETVREAFEISYLGTSKNNSDDCGNEMLSAAAAAAAAEPVTAEVYGIKARHRSRGVVRVKDLSRLWTYRNGKAPVELPPSVILGRGFARMPTL